MLQKEKPSIESRGVSIGRGTQAICLFWNGLRTFEHVDCLQQQVIRLYIFEY